MQSYSGSNLTPLFHSEITSSYMLFDLFNSHPSLISQFIQDKFHLTPHDIHVQRERSYPQKGSIDIFIEFRCENKKHALLIEVKVHDYLSTTDGQINTYYKAVVEDGSYDEVYFIYLTQFNAQSTFIDCASPATIDEARRGAQLIGPKFKHITWEQVHAYLESFESGFSPEQQLMLNLQKAWIFIQCQTDIENNKIDVGLRSLDDYFPDIQANIHEQLPFGMEIFENRRQIWRVDISRLDEQQIIAVLNLINTYTQSASVNKLKQYKTEETTLQAAQDFLSEMAQGTNEWLPLSFYARLFDFISRTSYLKFNGSGTRGFSIKLEVKQKGEISLCTIYRNKTMDFSTRR